MMILPNMIQSAEEPIMEVITLQTLCDALNKPNVFNVLQRGAQCAEAVADHTKYQLPQLKDHSQLFMF